MTHDGVSRSGLSAEPARTSSTWGLSIADDVFRHTSEEPAADATSTMAGQHDQILLAGQLDDFTNDCTADHLKEIDTPSHAIRCLMPSR